jgi:putative aminopeptidase FrvX
MPIPKTLKDMLALPTAAFAERAVMDYVTAACRRLPGVSTTFDRYGNLLAHYRYRPRRVTPLIFAAHTDHPGFVAMQMEGPRTLRAAFRGWVEPEYFQTAGVRFFSDGRWIKGRVTELTKVTDIRGFVGRLTRPEEVLLRVSAAVAPGSPGVWDLPGPALKSDRVAAVTCDDVAGSAAMLALLEQLSRRRARAEAYCLFTRAEELGFVGAIAAAKAGTLPRRLPIIAIETSKELPGAPIGDGPILRVGDRMSVFTPALTAFCNRVARGLMERTGGLRYAQSAAAAAATVGRVSRPDTSSRIRVGWASGRAMPPPRVFLYQRKLMDGGTCESTAYMEYGYAATGVCLALGNYHNMDTQRRRLAPAIISLGDWLRMVRVFVALVADETGFGSSDTTMRDSLDKRFEQYRPLMTSGRVKR